MKFSKTNSMLGALQFLALLALSKADACLEFQPSHLTMQDIQGGATFQVKMTKKPSGPCSVNFQTTDLQVGNCSIAFSPEDYSTFKTVQLMGGSSVISSGSSISSTVHTVVYSPYAADVSAGIHNFSLDYGVTRNQVNTKSCKALGDPHYCSFDGKTYDYMAYSSKGHYLVKHDNLKVVAKTFSCSATASCNSHIAVHYNGAVVIIQAVASASQQIVQATSGDLATHGCYLHSNGDSSYIMDLDDGTSMTFNIGTFGDNLYVDHVINLPGQYSNQVNGYCGNYNGNQGDDFGGSTQGEYDVDDSDDFFTCGGSCSGIQQKAYSLCTLPPAPPVTSTPSPAPSPPSTAVPTPPAVSPVAATNATTASNATAASPPPVAVFPPATAVSPSTTTTTAPISAPGNTTSASSPPSWMPQATTPPRPAQPPCDYKGYTFLSKLPIQSGPSPSAPAPQANSTSTSLVSCPNSFKQQAQQNCKNVYSKMTCGNHVDQSFYINACVSDAITTGSISNFLEGNYFSYMNECMNKVKCMHSSKVSKDVTAAEQLQTQCGFGNSGCPNGCSGSRNGQCTSSGCRCNSGYTGYDCSISTHSFPAFNRESGKSCSQSSLPSHWLGGLKNPNFNELSQTIGAAAADSSKNVTTSVTGDAARSSVGASMLFVSAVSVIAALFV